MELSKRGKIISGLTPIDATGAAKNGDYISMKNAAHCTVILHFGVSLVATQAITLTQATEVAGSTTKALGFDLIQVNADVTATDTFVETTVTSDTIDKSAASEQLFAIEIDADDLDVDNGYDCFRVNLESPGGQATLVSILYICTELRYAAAVPVSQIID